MPEHGTIAAGSGLGRLAEGTDRRAPQECRSAHLHLVGLEDAEEMLAATLVSSHNLAFLARLMAGARAAIVATRSITAPPARRGSG